MFNIAECAVCCCKLHCPMAENAKRFINLCTNRLANADKYEVFMCRGYV